MKNTKVGGNVNKICGYCGKEIKNMNDYGYYSILGGLIDSRTGSLFQFHQSCHLKIEIKSLNKKIKDDLKRISDLKKQLKQII